MMRPRCIMMSRSPSVAACDIECVTISAVNLSRAMISSLTRITLSPLFGSSAAVCSSRRRISGLSQVAINSVNACRSPPERVPIAFANRLSSPMWSTRTRSCNSCIQPCPSAGPNPRLRPRRAESARFSAIDMVGAVPLKGFRNTRPINDARRCSGQRVTSRPPRWIDPESTKKVPATAFNSVLFPDPFVPITVTNEPSSMESETSRSERTSLIVSGLNVFEIWRSSSMRHLRLPRPQLAEQGGQDKRSEHEDRRDQLQVIRIEAPPQRHGNEQSKQHRAHDGADNGKTQRSHADQSLSDNDARQAPDQHPDAHLHIGKALILSEQRAGHGNQAVRDGESENHHGADVHAERADHLRIVAGCPHRGTEMGAEKPVE